MKGKQLEFSKLKHKLFQMRSKGVKNPIWKLNTEQLEYIVNLGFKVIPRIYRINTKTFNNPKNLNGLLKDIHYSKLKKSKKEILRKISKKDLETLKEYDVRVIPYKYEIKLR